MTTCQELQPMLALAPEEWTEPARALLSHVDSCPQCRARQAMYAGLRAATTSHATRHAAPAALRTRLVAALDAAEVPLRPPSPTPARVPWLALAGGWFAAGACACALLLVLAFGVAFRPLPASLPDVALAAGAQAFIDNHARAVVTGHLIDVASSDRHTVKPWFRGRIDFSPPVIDLAAQGFPLVGGRLDYVGRRSVAVLVYQRRQHVIDLYVWPDGNGVAQAATTAPDIRGYHCVTTRVAGTAFAAVSDLDANELGELARDYAQGLQALPVDGSRQ